MKQREENKLTYQEYVEWRKTHKSNGDEVDKSKYSKANTKRLTREETVSEKNLKIARILKENGVDLSKIHLTKMVNGKLKYILLEEIEQDGIDMQKIIQENGLDGKFEYGGRVINLRSAYKGMGGYKITEEQKKELEELGLISSKETAAEEALKIARILKKNGVDLGKIPLTKTVNGKQRYILLEEIEQNGIDIQKIIQKNELDGKFKYGSRIRNLRYIYNGTVDYKITEGQKKEIKELGLISSKETATEKNLKIARILKKNGVDLSKIQLAKSVNGKIKYILLEEIKQDGIDMQKIIQENGLDGKFEYGRRAINLRSAYKGTVDYEITEEQKKELEELGLLISSKETAAEEALKIARILKENGVDLSKIQLTKMVNEKPRYILLEEIEQDGIDMQEIIQENGLDGKFKYGRRIKNLRDMYNGTVDYKITEEQKRKAEELGLISKSLMDREKQKQQAERENQEAKELYSQYEELLEDRNSDKHIR